MTREAMEPIRRYRNDDHVRRGNTESHSRRGSVRNAHNGDNFENRHRQSEKEKPRHSREDRQRYLDRREWRSRNSPVVIIARGTKHVSSSSSEESRNPSSSQGKNQNHKRQHDESLEELSRRKRRIESEINALDAEEATTSRGGKTQRPQSRNRRKEEHRGERLVRIKEEPCSDSERPTMSRAESRLRRSNSGERNAEWGRPHEKQAKPTKEKPNFETSGKLAEDTNTYNGVVIKYNEPSEARKPKRKWRLYPFKGSTPLTFIPIHRQSAYLLGRTRLIADIPIDHPSCSKQHAVLQYRVLPYKREDGTTGRSVRPFIIDLESANGTFVNNKRIEPRRYVELLEQDVLKFGFSSREYVILHEDSKYADNVDSS